AMIAVARAADAAVTARYYAEGTTGTEPVPTAPLQPFGETAMPLEQQVEPKPKEGFWKRVMRRFFG
ncbi:MAG: hypothetical protein ABGY75_19715, partial [Gemmataceae bacterium]